MSEEEQLFTDYTGRITITLSIGWMTILLGRELLPPLLPTIIDQFAITSARAGLALTILWVSYALAQYPAGRLADGTNSTTVLVPSVAVTVVGFFGILVAETFPMFVGGVVLVGLGSGFFFVPNRVMLTELFVAKRAQVFGIQGASGSLGSAMAAVLSTAVVAYAVWQLAFVPVIVVLLAVIVLIHAFSQESYDLHVPELQVVETCRRVFSSRTIWLAVFGYTMFSIAWTGTIGFLPTFLQAEKGFSPLVANASFGLVFLVGILAEPAAGRLGDHVSRIRITMWGLLVAIVGILGMLLSESLFVVVGVIVFALGIRSFPPNMQAYIMEVVPGENKGGDFGMLKTVYTGLGAVGPYYVGAVNEAIDYSAAFAGLTVFLLLGVGSLYALERA